MKKFDTSTALARVLAKRAAEQVLTVAAPENAQDIIGESLCVHPQVERIDFLNFPPYVRDVKRQIKDDAVAEEQALALCGDHAVQSATQIAPPVPAVKSQHAYVAPPTHQYTAEDDRSTDTGDPEACSTRYAKPSVKDVLRNAAVGHHGREDSQPNVFMEDGSVLGATAQEPALPKAPEVTQQEIIAQAAPQMPSVRPRTAPGHRGGRAKEYTSAAARQKAYRDRKKAEANP